MDPAKQARLEVQEKAKREREAQDRALQKAARQQYRRELRTLFVCKLQTNWPYGLAGSVASVVLARSVVVFPITLGLYAGLQYGRAWWTVPKPEI